MSSYNDISCINQNCKNFYYKKCIFCNKKYCKDCLYQHSNKCLLLKSTKSIDYNVKDYNVKDYNVKCLTIPSIRHTYTKYNFWSR